MLNPSQEQNLKYPNSNSIQELEQMMTRKRLTDPMPNKNLSNQPSYVASSTQPTSNHMSLNKFIMQSVASPQNLCHNNQVTINQIRPSNLPNFYQQTNLNRPIQTRFNVPNINQYLQPNYENLNAFPPINHQVSQIKSNFNLSNLSNLNQQQSPNVIKPKLISPNITGLPDVNHISTTKNTNWISPNVTGLPEVTIKKKSPSQYDNIYANSEIVSRYCPTTNTSPKSYYSTSVDQNNENDSKNSPSLSKKSNSFYDPVYSRANSQLSFNSSKKPDSVNSSYISSSNILSTSRPKLPPAPESLTGSQQPISALLNEQNLVYSNQANIKHHDNAIDHLKKEKENEVDYLTDLLVNRMRVNNDDDFFGKL